MSKTYLFVAMMMVTSPTFAQAANGPCPRTFSDAVSGTKQFKTMSSIDGDFESEHELEVGGIEVLGEPVEQIFLYDSIGGGVISYLFGGNADDLRAALLRAYSKVGQCTESSCKFAGETRGDLEQARIATSFRALTNEGERIIQKPTLICSFR